MRRPGRSRAHERQRQNRVPFVRDGGADKPRRGGVFPRGDSQSGPLAPFLLDRQQFHDSPMNSSANQNHRPSHRPSSTSLTESPLRGSAGVPRAASPPPKFLSPATQTMHTHSTTCTTARDETGAGGFIGPSPVPAPPAGGLSEKRERATSAIGHHPQASAAVQGQSSARCAHGTAPVRRGYFIERYCK